MDGSALEAAAKAVWEQQHLRHNRPLKYPWRSDQLPDFFWEEILMDVKVACCYYWEVPSGEESD